MLVTTLIFEMPHLALRSHVTLLLQFVFCGGFCVFIIIYFFASDTQKASYFCQHIKKDVIIIIIIIIIIINFSFQPVLHDWCNKDRGMYYPVCGMMHIKITLAVNRKE